MRHLLPAFALLLLTAPALAPGRSAPDRPPIAVLFSPHGGCTDRIVAEIDAARSQIRVQAYSFTSRPIVDALLRAKARGVDVSIILDDRSNGGNPIGPELIARGIPVAYDATHAISHNKLIIIDGLAVIGGSFNFSANAEVANAENLTVIASPVIAALYLGNWAKHAAHSGPHVARMQAGPPPEF